ncbi:MULTISPECIES: FxSxx-COOH cyclophane-containing RiPP peptide [Streptomyces]|uniref:FxSxx-COOH cyclophane-containing RiPP peptide n=1 Tax=Streptomyces TaxID=1883 RepID=UPI00124F7950|nr:MULTISPECIES: FxSxx-COOH cyclophane-containing RiPP peptide [Streptomyces]NYV78856.1 FXSXX-COOH protein [Streptomyces sp. UH6]
MTDRDARDLPDLTALDLESLRRLDHPVLRDVLERLQARQDDGTETLWGFNNSAPQ